MSEWVDKLLVAQAANDQEWAAMREAADELVPALEEVAEAVGVFLGRWAAAGLDTKQGIAALITMALIGHDAIRDGTV